MPSPLNILLSAPAQTQTKSNILNQPSNQREGKKNEERDKWKQSLQDANNHAYYQMSTIIHATYYELMRNKFSPRPHTT